MEGIIAGLIAQFENGKISRRQLIQSLAVTVAAPALAAEKPKGFKAVAVNHISYEVKDYARTRDFYAELLGMEVKLDTGEQCHLAFGNSFLIPRGSRQPGGKPYVNHIAYTIANWNKNEVEENLLRRGFAPRQDTVDSFHIRDPDGFDLQISGENMNAMTP